MKGCALREGWNLSREMDEVDIGLGSIVGRRYRVPLLLRGTALVPVGVLIRTEIWKYKASYWLQKIDPDALLRRR